MDRKKSVLNITVSIISRVLLLIVALFTRRLLIRYLGNDINGLNSLYSSIIGMLAVAELGIGSAITFSMYKPIVQGDDNTVVGLYCLYRKIYLIIGCVIFCAGLVILPFLPKLINIMSREIIRLQEFHGMEISFTMVKYLFPTMSLM